jgi:hypothetical protein
MTRKKITEWEDEIRSLNPTHDELEEYINNKLPFDIYALLPGKFSREKALLLLEKWEDEPIQSTDIQLLARILKNELAHVDKLWEENQVGHAYIVGYLTGVIKTAIGELEG